MAGRADGQVRRVRRDTRPRRALPPHHSRPPPHPLVVRQTALGTTVLSQPVLAPLPPPLLYTTTNEAGGRQVVPHPTWLILQLLYDLALFTKGGVSVVVRMTRGSLNLLLLSHHHQHPQSNSWFANAIKTQRHQVLGISRLYTHFILSTMDNGSANEKMWCDS